MGTNKKGGNNTMILFVFVLSRPGRRHEPTKRGTSYIPRYLHR